ncbi:MAG TPA: type II secretion system F family protein [Caulobacteraceae bacterium]|jgi:tight adherence protein C|nr:type II secretion system F family protein [Caulobacteraceae bacterium]
MSLVETLTNPDNVVAAGVGLISFFTIVTVVSPAFQQSGLESRLKSVANRREELRRRSREALAAGKNGAPSLRRTDEGVFKRLNERLQLSRLLEDTNLTDKLAQAGYRGPSAISRFYVFRLFTPIVLSIGAAIYVFGLNGMHLPFMQRVAACVGALVAGYYAPNMYVSNVATKRRDSIVNVFPDALDLLLICVESGMSIESAILKVSQEVGGSSMELAEEMSLLSAELSYLPERRQAYENLGRRTNHPGIKAVVTAMVQAERYGTPLGNALRVMAKENRELRLAAAEKKAASLPPKLTVPMILFFLPVLFVVILGPALMRVQDTLGHH